jgi:hypothetical protein
MGYIVYVNESHKKAVVHEENCKCVKILRSKGKGIGKSGNDYWSQVFPNLSDACNFAKSTGKQTVNCCKICLKNSNCC